MIISFKSIRLFEIFEGKNVGDAMKAAKFIQEKRDITNDRSQSDVSGRIFKRNKWESKLKGHLEVHSNKPRPNAFECWLCHRLSVFS